MDVCLGLYDDYYFLYVALGQAEEEAPETGDTAPIFICTLTVTASLFACCAVYGKKRYYR
ncbi:MAG: hypothetical protein II777_04030, partial [Clostridia bacterium]|nr:hypothetical protein [Clostridia bacterium]